jgi:Flp pilus assembly protein TadD
MLIGAALATAFHRLEPWRPVRAALALAVLGISLAAAAAVHQRVETWSDPVRLWTDATRKAPSSSRAWNNLGNALRTRAPGEALVAVRRSLALDPSNTHALANLFNLEALCPFDCPAH